MTNKISEKSLARPLINMFKNYKIQNTSKTSKACNRDHVENFRQCYVTWQYSRLFTSKIYQNMWVGEFLTVVTRAD